MRDALPPDLKEGAYVYNQDSQTGTGTHWCCFCLKKPYIYYVDPFGTDLNGYPPSELRSWGYTHGYTKLYANEEDFQHLKSWLCGWYACYFALKMNKHFKSLTPTTFDRIIQKGIDKYPTSNNINIITKWGKAKGIM